MTDGERCDLPKRLDVVARRTECDDHRKVAALISEKTTEPLVNMRLVLGRTRARSRA